jgi:hypothetical protein
MRGLSTYILAGVLAVVAMDISVLPGAGSAIGAWPQIAPAEMTQPAIQQVNRSGKGDRLDLRQTVVGKSRVMQQSPAIEQTPSALPQGCEPAFSTLTASAAYAGNFVRGCIS